MFVCLGGVVLTRNMDKQSESYIPPPPRPFAGSGWGVSLGGVYSLNFFVENKKKEVIPDWSVW